MTRDMELIRKILLAVAATERPLDSMMVRIAHYTPDQITEHVRLLHDARLLDGNPLVGADRRLRWNELRLTWIGHDFVECARNETIWRMATEALGEDRSAASISAWHRKLIESTYRVMGRSKMGS